VHSPARSTVGTLNYLSPEQLEQRLIQREIKSNKSDIWSLGLTLLEVTIGRFSNETEILYEPDHTFDDLVYLFNTKTPTKSSSDFQRAFLSEYFLQFCRNCLDKDSEKRFTAQQLIV
jgi:serine/threonine protein kinase